MALKPMARAALEAQVPLLREGPYAARYGWQIDMDWETGLCHAKLHCTYRGADQPLEHTYLLRLSFEYYPIEQPGVIFVSPESREIGTVGTFERWWPNVDGNPWINIQINAADPPKSYLCFQWTQEFKQTHAAPAAEDPKKWDAKKHNLVGVVKMVQRALSSDYYKGFRKV